MANQASEVQFDKIHRLTAKLIADYGASEAIIRLSSIQKDSTKLINDTSVADLFLSLTCDYYNVSPKSIINNKGWKWANKRAVLFYLTKNNTGFSIEKICSHFSLKAGMVRASILKMEGCINDPRFAKDLVEDVRFIQEQFNKIIKQDVEIKS